MAARRAWLHAARGGGRWGRRTCVRAEGPEDPASPGRRTLALVKELGLPSAMIDRPEGMTE